MGRTRIRWKYLGRVAAGVVLVLVAIFLLPGVLAPPKAPPLADDIGLRTGATGASPFVPPSGREGDGRRAGGRVPRAPRRAAAKRRGAGPASEGRPRRSGAGKPDGSASETAAAASIPGPADPPSVAPAPAPAASIPAAAAPPTATPAPIPQPGSSSSGGSGPSAVSSAGGDGGSGSAANPGAGHTAPPSASGLTQFGFEH